MNGTQTATRIIAGVLPAMALFATSAGAQELQTQTTPPPVPSQAAPAQAAPAPEPAAPVAAAPATSSPDAQTRYQASLDAATGRTASANAPAASEAPARRAVTRSTAPGSRTARPATVAPAAAPVAAAPVAVPSAPAPAAELAAPVAAAPAVAPAVTSGAPATQASEASTTTTGTPVWAWLVGGLAAIAAIALGIFALRRRREEDVEWVEDDQYVDVQPVAMAAPLAADEPVVEHAEVVNPPLDEVAALTDGAAPVAGRPWIELSLRPLRAGATEESALVDLELTLANAGEVAAQDVRVSTFMLGDAADAPTEMDRLLAGGHAGTEVDAGAIGAGEGSRIDARLAIPREEMNGASTFQPVVVADVRYRLPNGGEGRTAAAFTVGVHDDTEDPTPLRLGGDIREDVAATLHGVPERV